MSRWLLFPMLSLILVAVAVWSLTLGAAPLPFPAVWHGLFGDGDPRAVVIMREIRLPRLLLGLVVGGALGLAGAALQGLLRNPLAEPGVIGTSSCAALGAVIALYFGWAAGFPLALPLSGMAGAALGTILLLIVAGRHAGTLTMILAGVAISSLASAATSLAMNLSPTPYAISEIVLWMMGSLKDRSIDDVSLALPFVLAGGAVILTTGRGLEALTLGEDGAVSLGVRMSRLRLAVIIGTALMVGAAVSVSGSVGFVGLVVPHLLRPCVRYRPRALLVPSALGGAALVTLADIAVRQIPSGAELMLGVVTSLVGAPFFLALMVKLRRGDAG